MIAVATTYEIQADDGAATGIKVEARGGIDSWAITQGRQCLSRSAGGRWDFEPQPSSRTDDWKADHRFTLDEAMQLAAVLVRERS